MAFFSFGGAAYGDSYYDTQRLDNVLKSECLLASHMNGRRLPELYGATLRSDRVLVLATTIQKYGYHVVMVDEGIGDNAPIKILRSEFP